MYLHRKPPRGRHGPVLHAQPAAPETITRQGQAGRCEHQPKRSVRHRTLCNGFRAIGQKSEQHQGSAKPARNPQRSLKTPNLTDKQEPFPHAYGRRWQDKAGSPEESSWRTASRPLHDKDDGAYPDEQQRQPEVDCEKDNPPRRHDPSPPLIKTPTPHPVRHNTTLGIGPMARSPTLPVTPAVCIIRRLLRSGVPNAR